MLNVYKRKNFAGSHTFCSRYLSLVICVVCNAVSVCKHGRECFPAVVLMSGRANQLLTAHSPWEWICQAVIELLSVLDASWFACQELSGCRGMSYIWVCRNEEVLNSTVFVPMFNIDIKTREVWVFMWYQCLIESVLQSKFCTLIHKELLHNYTTKWQQ